MDERFLRRWMSLIIRWARTVLHVGYPCRSTTHPISACSDLDDVQKPSQNIRRKSSFTLKFDVNDQCMITLVFQFTCMVVLDWRLYLTIWCALWYMAGSICCTDYSGLVRWRQGTSYPLDVGTIPSKDNIFLFRCHIWVWFPLPMTFLV